VAEVKNYGLSGVHRTLQLGKQGPVLVGNADTDSFTVTLQDAATLTTMGGANATSGTHFITKSQLDSVYTEATFLANVNYNDTSPILLGNISYGTKTIITTFEVTTAFDANAVVTIGDASDNNLLMSDNYAEIEVVGTYQTINTVEFASNSALNIYVTQGGATQGAGTVLVSVVDGPVVNAGAVNYGGGTSPTNTITNTDGSNNFDVTVQANGVISMNTLRGGLEFGALPEPGGISHLHIMRPAGQEGSTDLYFGDDYNFIRMQGLSGAASQGVDIGSSYNNGTVYVWRFDTDGNLKLPAGGGIVDSTGNSVLGVGGITLANISVTSNSPSGNGSLTYNNSTGVFTFTPADLSSVAGNYGNSNVVTLLSSFGSNTISTSGNISAGNINSAAGRSIFLGNTSSSLRQLGSNASVNLGGSVTLIPDTSASATNGVQIGGNGYLLGPNGSRNITLNYSANGGVGFQSNITVGTAGIGGTANIAGATTTGINSLFAGVTNTILSNTIAAFSASVNSYTQVTLQNKSTGADATADFVITADNGSDTVNFADFGIINSGYDNTTPTNSLGNIVFAADTYLYAQGNASNAAQPGGNIAIGTTVTGKTVKIFAGGANSTAIVGTFSNTGLAVNGNVTATNLSGNISITGNVTGTSPNVTLVAGSYSWTFDHGGVLTLPGGSGGGNEGGEISFTQAANSTLAGNTVVIDQYVDRIRFFEGGGNARGAYIDLSIAPDGVGALLNNRVSGIVNAGVDVTLGNLKARIPTSGNRSLQVSTVSGTYSVYGSSVYNAGGVVGGTNINNSSPLSVTTTPAYLSSGNSFGTGGDSGSWTIMDTSAGLAWRISFVIGASYNNNMICIERLV
jgi:hypothetical protein